MNKNAIHGTPKKGRGWRIALSNHYAWLQTRGWRMYERKRNSWGSEKGEAGPNGPPGFFHLKKENILFAKKNKSFARAPYLRETIYLW